MPGALTTIVLTEGSQMRTKKIGRREVLGAMGAAAGAALAFGCGGPPHRPGQTGSAPTQTRSPHSARRGTPNETAGPYPSLLDFYRSDIREGKTGTLLTLTVK